MKKIRIWMLVTILLMQIIFPMINSFTLISKAEEEWDISADRIIATLNNGTLTISGTGAMQSWDGYGSAPWGGKIFEIKKVVIESGVTTISDFAFSNCLELKTIEIADTVTSIGEAAFSGCTNLTSISIPKRVEFIGNYAFRDCDNLEKINVDKNNEMYSSNDGVLYNKDMTELICYPSGKKATSFTTPASVTNIREYAFYRNQNLESIIVSEGPTVINESTFYTCIKLKSVSLPNTIVEIGINAFASCEKLIDIIIPESVVTIGSCAFQGCDSLKAINVPKNVTNIGERAFQCKKIEKIEVEEANQNYTSEDGILYDKEKTILIQYPAGKTDTSFQVPNTVKKIGNYAFCESENLEKVEIPESVEIIGLAGFYGCTNLDNVVIPNSVTEINSSAFSNCEKLTNITLSKELTVIEFETFANCTSLKEVIIPNKVEKLGDSAFSNCEALINVEIANSVKEIGNLTFSRCTSLENINIPASVTNIGEKVFSYCSNLNTINVDSNNLNYSSQIGILYNKDRTELICYPAGKSESSFTIPNGVIKIGRYAFEAVANLETVDMSQSITEIGGYAFYECKKLNEIAFSENLTQIEEYTFCYCESLTSVTFTEKIDTIGLCSFYGCSNLTSAIIPENVTSIDPYAFDECDDLTIYCYRDSCAHIYAEEYDINYVIIGESENIYKIKEENGIKYLYNVSPDTVMIQLLEEIKQSGEIAQELRKAENNSSVAIYSGKTEIKTNYTLIATGMTVKVTIDGKQQQYIIIVTGDINGDGKANLNDILAINKHRLNKSKLKSEYLMAGDVNGDNEVDLKDILQINKYRLGKTTKL